MDIKSPTNKTKVAAIAANPRRSIPALDTIPVLTPERAASPAIPAAPNNIKNSCEVLIFAGSIIAFKIIDEGLFDVICPVIKNIISIKISIDKNVINFPILNSSYEYPP